MGVAIAFRAYNEQTIIAALNRVAQASASEYRQFIENLAPQIATESPKPEVSLRGIAYGSEL